MSQYPQQYPDPYTSHAMHYNQVSMEPATSTTHIVIAWIVAVLSALYFLPWAIAATRRTPSSITILFVTFLTGWTGIGWLVCLIWACTAAVPSTYLAAPAQQQSVNNVITVQPVFHIQQPTYPTTGQYPAADGSYYPQPQPQAQTAQYPAVGYPPAQQTPAYYPNGQDAPAENYWQQPATGPDGTLQYPSRPSS